MGRYARIGELNASSSIDHTKTIEKAKGIHKEVMVRDVIQGIRDKSQGFVNNLTAVHKKLIERDKNKESKWVKKVSHLLSRDYTDNYIGFIYMDGRNVGTLFRKVLLDETLTDEEFVKRYTEVSQGLYNCLVEAAVKTA